MIIVIIKVFDSLSKCYDIVEKELTSQQASTSRDMEEWKENEFLPKGWR